jgi:hypothetical protein
MALSIDAVDRGVRGGKLLQGLDVSEAGHRFFSSSERLMCVSARLLSQRPHTWRRSTPISFIAAPWERRRSVAMAWGLR